MFMFVIMMATVFQPAVTCGDIIDNGQSPSSHVDILVSLHSIAVSQNFIYILIVNKVTEYNYLILYRTLSTVN